MRIYTYLFLLAILFVSCDKSSTSEFTPDPKASFSINYQLVRINDKVVITNDSDTSNIEKFIWNFGGKTIETTTLDKELNYNFNESGIYHIKLTAITKDNKKDSLTKEITVGNSYIHEVLIYDPLASPYYNEEWDPNEEGDNRYPDVQLQINYKGNPIYTSEIFYNYNAKSDIKINIPNIQFYNLKDSDTEIQINDIDENSKEIIFSSKNLAMHMDEYTPSFQSGLIIQNNGNVSINYYYHVE